MKADPEVADAARAELLKRLDGIAPILAKTAARDTTLIALLEPDGLDLHRRAALPPRLAPRVGRRPGPRRAHHHRRARRAGPSSARARSSRHPCARASSPTRSSPPTSPRPRPRGRRAPPRELGAPRPAVQVVRDRLGRQAAHMDLPQAPKVDRLARGLELMTHQSGSHRGGSRRAPRLPPRRRARPRQDRAVGARGIRRRRLPAARGRAERREDELGPRGGALDAAPPRHGDPRRRRLARRVRRRGRRQLRRARPPHRRGSATLGFKGMVVDEAHFIKNLRRSARATCSRSPTASAHTPGGDPLLLALTGTPLINDVDDFRAIWQFLGWIKGDKPSPALLETRGDRAHARRPRLLRRRPARSSTSASCVAARSTSPPTCPTSASPTCPSSSTTSSGRSIRAAERELGNRLVGATARSRRAAPAHRRPRRGQRDQFIRAARARSSRSRRRRTGENVFTMVRRIGQAKAGLAADYAAQLALWSARSCSSPSTSTSWTPAEAPSPPASSARCRCVATRPPWPRQAGDRRVQQGPRGRRRGLLADRGRCRRQPAGASNVVLAELSWTAPSRRRRSTACTASVRTSRSPRGASSRRTRSTPGSPS